MSRDPFDEMKSHNPVTGEGLPGAPMSVADRILARRPRAAWPGWAVAAAAAISVALVGFGMLWFFNEGSGNGVAEGDTSTTGAVTSTTSEESPSTTIVTREVEGVVYFFVDQLGEGWSGGPFLVPVRVNLEAADYPTEPERISAEVYSTMVQLLAGVGDDASATPALSSAIPSGTFISGVGVEDETGIVDVYLSGEFGSGGGSASMIGRVGQVVYSLTAIDGVTGVRFYVDDVLTTVFGGEGFVVDNPATREEFDDLLPAILIESPAFGAEVDNPLIASGTANVFEATVSVTLTDGDGLIIFEGFTTATCGTGCRGDWEIAIPYEVDALQMGSLIVWESSARDGSQTNVREHPVWLVPAGPDTATTTPSTSLPTGCSGLNASPDLVEPADLPAAVVAEREAIFTAARACDWEALRSLLGAGFSYSFGIDTDAIAYWQELEASGDDPMYYLAELLNRPFGVLEYDTDVTYFVWPSAFNQNGWQDVPEADVEALRPLYADEDFAGFAAFGGYIGYRVGILEDGTWVFFLEGD